MKLYRITLQGKSVFATIPKGDTLFGQVCWAIQEQFGTQKLTEYLTGYGKGNPFLILSDFLPENTVLRPPVPLSYFGIRPEANERKDFKRRTVIRIQDLATKNWTINKALLESQNFLLNDNEGFRLSTSIRARNTIDRETSHTGTDFPPFSNYAYQYSVQAKVHHRFASFTLFVLLDPGKFQVEEFKTVLRQIGTLGFGKDATIGRGKFELLEMEPFEFSCANPNSMLTLSPSVINSEKFEGLFYKPFTRFGKHGPQVLGSKIWKAPIIMADTFALLQTQVQKQFVGKGIGGDGSLSHLMPETVHQGYAITMPLSLRGEA